LKFVSAPLFLLLLLLSACGAGHHAALDYGVKGIDVSRYQGLINWEKAAGASLDFAFVKATEGGDYHDPLFSRNWEILYQNHIRRGAYHFYRPGIAANVQANNFIDRVENLQPGDLPPVLDVELRGNQPLEEFLGELEEWLLLVEARFGLRPILYTGQKFYNRYLAGRFNGYPVWIARYGKEAPVLADGRNFQFWQYVDAGKLAGIQGPVDLNVFSGSLTELAKLCVPPDRTAEISTLRPH